jgi:prenylcysteine oxidase/farnesylcysteine lyase
LTNTLQIGAPFSTDIIQASTRVNYGSNLATIHGLETMVCMAIEGAMSVEGGNWQIFNSMLKASNATVNLNTTVTSIKKSKGKYILAVSDTNEHPSSLSERSSSFDTVVLAAPFQFSNIELEVDLLKKTPDKIPYVQLHVTLFTSTEKLSPRFFGLQTDEIVPDSILTTLPPDTAAPSDPTKGVGPTGFFSISTLRTLVNPKTLQKEYLYKIFSPKKVTAAFLFDLLGTDALPEDLSMISQESGHAVSWYYPKVWYSYPYELPRVTFEELELAQGFYYTSGIESFISTMETSALMGMNIAQLIVDDYLQVQDVKSQVVFSEKMVDEL